MANYQEMVLGAAQALIEGAGGEIPQGATYNEIVMLAAAQIVTDPPISTSALNPLDIGQETIPRLLAVTPASMVTGMLRLAYFTARKSETVTKVRVITAGTGAGATPTLARIGIYSIAGNGDLTLIGSTVNDTALFATPNTAYEKALASGVALVTGGRYAVGVLVVTVRTAPVIVGGSSTPASSEGALSPRLNGVLAGQTDLPASILAAASNATTPVPYAVLVP